MVQSNIINPIFEFYFSEKSQKNIEKIVLILASIGFLIHLLLIAMNYLNIFDLPPFFDQNLFTNPISSIYTPFSFILIYEIYLLVFFIPRSFTTSISKQFQIILLIIIRRIFKDIPNLDLGHNWYLSKINFEILSHLIGVLALFYMIYLFNKNQLRHRAKSLDNKTKNFIISKKAVSISLISILIIKLIYILTSCLYYLIKTNNYVLNSNNIDSFFFNDFFTMLILTDVIILLISFKYTEEYNKLIRNTGFIISTILIRISFSAIGLLSTTLIIISALFALIVLKIFNKAENIN